nr:hypothetical protein [Tanacetum cinerariifolium]
MLKHNIPPDPYTYPSMFKACTSLNLHSLGLSFHQHAIVYGFASDTYISASLISFYAKFGFSEAAYKVFDVMPVRNVVPWTAIIACFMKIGDVGFTRRLFWEMDFEGVRPSAVTLLTMLSGVTEGCYVECFHACAVKYGFRDDLALVNCLLSSYGKCERVEDARKLFELMGERDVVSWNSLISAYGLIGDVGEIEHLLSRMCASGLEPDQQTFGTLISAAARHGNLVRCDGCDLHVRRRCDAGEAWSPPDGLLWDNVHT